MRFVKCALATSIMALAFAGTATAAPITVGSLLTGEFGPGKGGGATLFNASIGQPGANAASPVNGAVVRWHLYGAEGGPFRLRILRPAGGASYTAVGTSAAVSGLGPGLSTYSTVLPIQAGETIGLDFSPGAVLGSASAPSSSIAGWSPILPEGATRPYDAPASGVEAGFNAEVQPQPTVTAVSPASGSFKGKTTVTVLGTDFASVSAVKFGAKAAVNFAVGSESLLTAIVPAGTPGTADVTVTTIAGTSTVTAADRYKYTACVVPRLKAKKLKAAKKRLKSAGCKTGRVTKEDGVTAKTGKVVGQSPKAGKKLKPGTKIKIILG
jgi:hypothetical protein